MTPLLEIVTILLDLDQTWLLRAPLPPQAVGCSVLRSPLPQLGKSPHPHTGYSPPAVDSTIPATH